MTDNGEQPAALPGKVLAHQIRTAAGKSTVNGINTLIMKGTALPGELRQQQNRGGGMKGVSNMANKEIYIESIHEMVDKIENLTYLRQIYTITYHLLKKFKKETDVK